MKVFALLFVLALNGRAADSALKFGVTPQVSLDKLAAIWGPLLEHVSKKSGVKLKLDSAATLPDFEDVHIQGGYDLAFVNPLVFVRASKAMRAVARENGTLQGILLVSASSPIQSLDELRGRRVAFPSPVAFAATKLNKIAIEGAGLNDGDTSIQYVGTQDAVYDAILSGSVDAGGGIPRTYEQLPADKKALLRVLNKTEPVVGFALSANRKASAEKVRKVAQALIALSSTPEGQALLAKVNIKGFIAAADPDFNGVRKYK